LLYLAVLNELLRHHTGADRFILFAAAFEPMADAAYFQSADVLDAAGLPAELELCLSRFSNTVRSYSVPASDKANADRR
jgi:hypothetical protein